VKKGQAMFALALSLKTIALLNIKYGHAVTPNGMKTKDRVAFPAKGVPSLLIAQRCGLKL